MAALSKIVMFSRLSKTSIIGLFVLFALSSLPALVQPVLMGRVIDLASSGNFESLSVIFSQMSCLFLLTLLLDFVKDKLSVALAAKSETVIRDRIVKSVLYCPEPVNQGNVLMSIEQDATILSQLIFNHMDIFIEIFTFLVTIVLLFLISSRLTWILLFFLPIQLITLSFFSRFFYQKEQLLKLEKESYINYIYETISGKITLRIFKTLAQRFEEFSVLNKDLSRHRVGYFMLRTYQDLAVHLVVYLANLILIFIGLSMVRQGNLTLGRFITVTTYIGTILSSSFRLSSLNIVVQSLQLSLKRLEPFMGETVDEETCQVIPKVEELQLRDVCFDYGDKAILTGVTQQFKKGKLHVLTSRSGTGKTTLMNLLAGLENVQSGEILINQVEQVTSLSDYRFSYMQQEPVIFSMSIYDNIRLYNPRTSLDDVIRMCEQLGIAQVILGLDEGFDTIISQANPILSGGQIQRLCLARTLLKEADVYLLDEPLSGLDGLTRSEVLTLLQDFSRQAIVLVSCHDNLGQLLSSVEIGLSQSDYCYGGSADVC